jgi:hypothetical protein
VVEVSSCLVTAGSSISFRWRSCLTSHVGQCPPSVVPIRRADFGQPAFDVMMTAMLEELNLKPVKVS